PITLWPSPTVSAAAYDQRLGCSSRRATRSVSRGMDDRLPSWARAAPAPATVATTRIALGMSRMRLPPWRPGIAAATPAASPRDRERRCPRPPGTSQGRSPRAARGFWYAPRHENASVGALVSGCVQPRRCPPAAGEHGGEQGLQSDGDRRQAESRREGGDRGAETKGDPGGDPEACPGRAGALRPRRGPRRAQGIG